MKQTIFRDSLLVCNMQAGTPTNNMVYAGMLTKCKSGFWFEEVAASKPYKRNPKIFEGMYCSLTHHKDGRYHINMNMMDAKMITNPEAFALEVFMEVLQAVKISLSSRPLQ